MSEVLDIGAGSYPIKEATVAIDAYGPTITHEQRQKIKVTKGRNVHPSLRNNTTLHLPADSRLREYVVGDAREMPEEWTGRFDHVHANSSVGIAAEISTPGFAREINRVLKPGGTVHIIANPGVPGFSPEENAKINTLPHTKAIAYIHECHKAHEPQQIRIAKAQENRLRRMLEGGGLEDVRPVEGYTSYAKGDVAVTARKPRYTVTRTVSKRPGRSKPVIMGTVR